MVTPATGRLQTLVTRTWWTISTVFCLMTAFQVTDLGSAGAFPSTWVKATRRHPVEIAWVAWPESVKDA